MCKESIKKSQPFVNKNEKCQDPSGPIFFVDSHYILFLKDADIVIQRMLHESFSYGSTHKSAIHL